MRTTTDNGALAAKLDLRRGFLRRFPEPGGFDVLDACQGAGVLWATLHAEFQVRSYWGLDLKRKKGRLKVDSLHVLARPGLAANVIDVDTYGSPWRHWLALLPNVTRPITVFLTMGWQNQSMMSAGRLEVEAIGLAPLLDRMPPTLTAHAVHALAPAHLLARALSAGLAIRAARVAETTRGTRYYGLRLEPKQDGAPADTDAPNEHGR